MFPRAPIINMKPVAWLGSAKLPNTNDNPLNP